MFQQFDKVLQELEMTFSKPPPQPSLNLLKCSESQLHVEDLAYAPATRTPQFPTLPADTKDSDGKSFPTSENKRSLRMIVECR